MKKNVSFIAAILCMVLLTGVWTGCGDADTDTEGESATLTCDADGVYQTITMDAVDDVVHTFTQISTLDLSEYDEDVVEEVEATVDELQETLGQYENTQYQCDVKNDIMTETVIIDLTDTEELIELVDSGFFPITGYDETMEISLEESIKELQSEGWTLLGSDAETDVSE